MCFTNLANLWFHIKILWILCKPDVITLCQTEANCNFYGWLCFLLSLCDTEQWVSDLLVCVYMYVLSWISCCVLLVYFLVCLVSFWFGENCYWDQQLICWEVASCARRRALSLVHAFSIAGPRKGLSSMSQRYRRNLPMMHTVNVNSLNSV